MHVSRPLYNCHALVVVLRETAWISSGFTNYDDDSNNVDDIDDDDFLGPCVDGFAGLELL